MIFNKKVKKPLACSLHEIAKIIGPEKSLKDLSFVFETFLTDSSNFNEKSKNNRIFN